MIRDTRTPFLRRWCPWRGPRRRWPNKTAGKASTAISRRPSRGNHRIYPACGYWNEQNTHARIQVHANAVWCIEKYHTIRSCIYVRSKAPWTNVMRNAPCPLIRLRLPLRFINGSRRPTLHHRWRSRNKDNSCVYKESPTKNHLLKEIVGGWYDGVGCSWKRWRHVDVIRWYR